MLSDANKKLIYEGIPSDFSSIHAEIGTVSKLYENQWVLIEDIKKQYPVITLEYISSIHQVNVPIDRIRYMSRVPTENIQYLTGTSTYAFTYDKATEIVQVVAVVAKVKKVLASSLYQLSGDTGIEFLGPTYPDDGTYFLVTYKMKWVISHYGGEFYDNLFINVRARDFRTSDDTFFNGLKLSHTIVNEIMEWFFYDADIQGILFTNFSEVRDLSVLEVTNILHRLQFDVQVRYVEHKTVKVEDIEIVEPTIEVS